MKEIADQTDWEKYIGEIDDSARYHYQHNGRPVKFPCLVKSDFWDDQNDPYNPYNYDHPFVYQKECTCGSCGHKTLEWNYEDAV